MSNRILAALVLLLAASVVHASGFKARQDVEASMLVTGTIEVDPQGRVERFVIDRPDAVPDYVTQLLSSTIPQWEFQPVLHEGQPASVRTPMRIRVAANELASESIALRVAGASFGDQHPTGGRRNEPPRYPRDALMKGVSATVYLLGRVDRDGTLVEVIAEQVNMRYLGPERTMAKLREAFAEASIRAAMKWTFATPEDVLASGASHWSMRVPVDFSINGMRTPGYGEWDSYVAGPRQTAWWEDDAAGADSFAAGGFYRVGEGLKLLTPLDGNG